MRDGWLALPDLAFRLHAPVQGITTALKFKWLGRDNYGDCYVLSPDDFNNLITKDVGSDLHEQIEAVKSFGLFNPTPEAIGKLFV